MTKAEEILEKHLAITDAETMIGKHGRTHKAVINAINEAIDYTHSCETLKDKEVMSFKEFVDTFVKTTVHNETYFYKNNEFYKIEKVKEMYDKKHSL